jgi:hypothetical protein
MKSSFGTIDSEFAVEGLCHYMLREIQQKCEEQKGFDHSANLNAIQFD